MGSAQDQYSCAYLHFASHFHHAHFLGTTFCPILIHRAHSMVITCFTSARQVVFALTNRQNLRMRHIQPQSRCQIQRQIPSLNLVSPESHLRRVWIRTKLDIDVFAAFLGIHEHRHHAGLQPQLHRPSHVGVKIKTKVCSAHFCRLAKRTLARTSLLVLLESRNRHLYHKRTVQLKTRY